MIMGDLNHLRGQPPPGRMPTATEAAQARAWQRIPQVDRKRIELMAENAAKREADLVVAMRSLLSLLEHPQPENGPLTADVCANARAAIAASEGTA